MINPLLLQHIEDYSDVIDNDDDDECVNTSSITNNNNHENDDRRRRTTKRVPQELGKNDVNCMYNYDVAVVQSTKNIDNKNNNNNINNNDNNDNTNNETVTPDNTTATATATTTSTGTNTIPTIRKIHNVLRVLYEEYSNKNKSYNNNINNVSIHAVIKILLIITVFIMVWSLFSTIITDMTFTTGTCTCTAGCRRTNTGTSNNSIVLPVVFLFGCIFGTIFSLLIFRLLNNNNVINNCIYYYWENVPTTNSIVPKPVVKTNATIKTNHVVHVVTNDESDNTITTSSAASASLLLSSPYQHQQLQQQQHHHLYQQQEQQKVVEQGKKQKQYKFIVQYIQERRLLLCQLLGSIGAPLLQLHPFLQQQNLGEVQIQVQPQEQEQLLSVLSPSSTTTTTRTTIDGSDMISTPQPHRQLQLEVQPTVDALKSTFDTIEEICTVHVNLLETVQCCIDIITNCSRIRYSLDSIGTASKSSVVCLDRIERRIASMAGTKTTTALLPETTNDRNTKNNNINNSVVVQQQQQQQQQQQPFSSNQLSLHILRRRVYCILERQLTLLHKTCDTCIGDIDEADTLLSESNFVNNNHMNFMHITTGSTSSYNDNNIVVTVSILRSMRKQLVHTISDTVSILYQRMIQQVLEQQQQQQNNHNDAINFLLSTTISSAVECNEYLKSSLYFTNYSNNNNTMNTCTDSKTVLKWLTQQYNDHDSTTGSRTQSSMIGTNLQSVVNNIENIQSTIQSIQRMVSCYYEICYNSTHFNNFWDDFQPWWYEFQNNFNLLQPIINTTNSNVDSIISLKNDQVNPQSDVNNSSTSEETIQRSNNKTTSIQQHEYTSSSSCNNEICTETASTTSNNNDTPKVVVYLGNGISSSSSSLKRLRPTASTISNSLSSNSTSTNPISHYEDDMTSLIDELKLYMKAMPSIPEMEVTNTATLQIVGNEQSCDDNTNISTADNGCTTTTTTTTTPSRNDCVVVTLSADDNEEDCEANDTGHLLCSVPMFSSNQQEILLNNNFLKDLQMSIQTICSNTEQR